MPRRLSTQPHNLNDIRLPSVQFFPDNHWPHNTDNHNPLTLRDGALVHQLTLSGYLGILGRLALAKVNTKRTQRRDPVTSIDQNCIF